MGLKKHLQRHKICAIMTSIIVGAAAGRTLDGCLTWERIDLLEKLAVKCFGLELPGLEKRLVTMAENGDIDAMTDAVISVGIEVTKAVRK